ncbi:PH domain-containing protein [Actinomadura macrotermitis]|uniref:Uncharacterized protein n=1 Tax=Actinomadura macrotermitis TaxID=2585200 RepID=A0A7K0C700_9ACTN|nr:PH domain-containing protein [Actinomadura macrotermitis]MQY09249.1 hypothetical protein [Actinomadura macrotermitis]
MAETPLCSAIQAAAHRMDIKTGAKREVRQLVGYPGEGETVRRMAAGTYGNGTGLSSSPTGGLFFLRDGWTSKKTEDFPFDKISSVRWTSGILTGALTVFASGNKAEIKSMLKMGGKTIADTIRERFASGPSYPARTPTPAPVPAPVAPPPGTRRADDHRRGARRTGEARPAAYLAWLRRRGIVRAGAEPDERLGRHR